MHYRIQQAPVPWEAGRHSTPQKSKERLGDLLQFSDTVPSPALDWHPGRVVGPRGRLRPLQETPPTGLSSSATSGGETWATSQCTRSDAPLRALPRAVRAASATRPARQEGTRSPPPLREGTPHLSHPVPHPDCSRGRWTGSGRKFPGRQPEVAGAQAGSRWGASRLLNYPSREASRRLRLLRAGARPACVATSPVLERCCGSARAPC